MRQMEEFVDDYYMTHHTAPKLQEISDNFHTVKSTVSRYLTEMAERGMIEYKDGVVSTYQPDTDFHAGIKQQTSPRRSLNGNPP